MPMPRKRFGQHFLRDDQIVQRIVNAIAPKPSDHLIEIGPGQGALTFPLLKRSHELDVIELDRDLIPILKEKSLTEGKINIFEADALRFDFAELAQDGRPLRIVGNLPYNISTPLIFHLLSYANLISDMCFMLQKEVVDRMAAQTNEEAYGRLSIMVQYHCKVTSLFDVPKEAFNPPPKVWSSIVKLEPYKQVPHPAKVYLVFENLVKQAFNQRRKTLRNALKHLVGDDIWAKTNLDPKKRPEEVSLAEFVDLSNLI